MKIQVSLSRDGKEFVSQTAEVSQTGDLKTLIGNTYDEARRKYNGPLWDFELAVRQS
jgi:hypothetical protein